MGDVVKMSMKAARVPVRLADAPIGLFFYGDVLCVKTEYGNNEGRIDTYIVSSGEFFWGDAPQTVRNQRNSMVHPVSSIVEPGPMEPTVVAVTVKPLEWTHFDESNVGPEEWVSDTYRIYRHPTTGLYGYRGGSYHTLEEAMDVAQVDRQAEVMSQVVVSTTGSPAADMAPDEQQFLSFLERKYTHSADERQREMGLEYIHAETHDLARELAHFVQWGH